MNFSFDLISDLHRETWPNFNWEGQPTSPFCIVAGDIARDRALVIDTLEQLGEVYHGVFYIDGNDEHKNYNDNLSHSYKELANLIEPIPNVVYLHENVVVINGVGIMATNGWWSYDFDPMLEIDQSIEWYKEKDQVDLTTALAVSGLAYGDANYLINTMAKMQKHPEVKAIIMVSHTVPAPWIIDHDLELIDTWRYNSMGNSHLSRVLHEDTESKVKAWCFGHYHRSVDRLYQGVRYINNPRGRGNTDFKQDAYYPKRITIEY
jgi:UDP-2,3-diacylglucosamine pyrophosphatase LpxH